MALKAAFHKDGEVLDYTPAAATTGGTVVEVAGLCGVTVEDIAASVVGSAQVKGIAKVEKINGAMAAEDEIWYDANGDPQGGTAGTGAATNVSNDGDIRMGLAAYAAGATDTHVYVILNEIPFADNFASIVGSTVITNLTAETDFDQKMTIPADTLKVGDVLKIKAMGKVIAQNGADTHNVKLYFGTEELAATGAINAPAADYFVFDAVVTVRVIGASGKIVASGFQILDAAGTAPLSFALDEATEATNVAVDVKLTSTCSVANAGNQIRLDQLSVEIVR